MASGEENDVVILPETGQISVQIKLMQMMNSLDILQKKIDETFFGF